MSEEIGDLHVAWSKGYLDGLSNRSKLYKEIEQLQSAVRQRENECRRLKNIIFKAVKLCDRYKSMQSEYEMDTEIPYWDIVSILKEER